MYRFIFDACLKLWKQNLIETLDDINNNITNEFYDGNVPLYDDVMAKSEAKQLRLKVEQTHSMLPHGHPDIMSWFDEAEWTHDQINQTADYLIGVLENITDHVESIASQTQVSFPIDNNLGLPSSNDIENCACRRF